MVRSAVIIFSVSLLVAFSTMPLRAAAADPTPLDELLDACFFDREPVINHLLDDDPGLVNDEKNFQVPLMRACAGRSLSAVKLLISRKANPQARTDDGNSPLWTAVEADDLPITRYLIDHGVNPRETVGPNEKERTPLFAARSKAMVDFLISRKLSVKATDTAGDTPLHAACAEGRRDVAEALLDHNADTEARDNAGRRPVHMAARSTATDGTPIIALLESHGADLRATGFKGQTALHEAALYNRTAALKYLISRKLDVNAKNDAGKTPLDLARIGKSKEAIEILLAHGAK